MLSKLALGQPAQAHTDKKTLGVKEIKVLADKGYYSTNDLVECETNHIETYVPKQKYTGSIANPDFQADKFQYDQEQDVYLCPAKYLIKEELMKAPWGTFFKATGGISVKRDKSENLVGHMVELFNRSEELVILLSPEGSRKLKGKWKTGFYHAALQAKVPIVLSSLDYKKKIAHVGLVFHPSGNYYQDMQQVIEYYRHITPRYPEKFALDII
jgi:hypothetical protein